MVKSIKENTEMIYGHLTVGASLFVLVFTYEKVYV